MRTTIRLFLFIEGASFLVAGLIHRGVFIAGYAHQQASIAETTIAVVLLLGLGLTWIWPAPLNANDFASTRLPPSKLTTPPVPVL